MWELRWILAALGAALIAALYVWDRVVRRAATDARASEGQGARPDDRSTASEPASGAPEDDTESVRDRERPKRRKPEKVIALRLVPKAAEISAEAAVLALREAGLRFGRYGIFHLHGEAEEASFSVASLVEPGAFDLGNLHDSTIPGLSIFMVLPGYGDPVNRFDLMVEAARTLAHVLDAELVDDRGSTWSIQRERYLREELIAYRHQIGQGAK
jgi:cell division protein ZipA